MGSKVSFAAGDGKSYTGTITQIQGEKYKIKYDGVDFEAWLLNDQFTVIKVTKQVENNQPPAPIPAIPQNIPEVMPQAQIETTPENSSPAMNGNPQHAPLTRSDSLKMAIANVKNAFNAASKLFAAKRDTITIVIPDIDYDNISLLLLREHIKRIKGVRAVAMNYNLSTAKLEIEYKGKPATLWDNIHPDARIKFKLIEAGENNITLKYLR
ncbi:MAG: hypothetical protein ACYCZO_03240 [Daejeonella sp.]